MTTLEECIRDARSFTVWNCILPTDYSEEDVDRHGIDTLLEIACENHAPECDVVFYGEEVCKIGEYKIADVEKYLRGAE